MTATAIDELRGAENYRRVDSAEIARRCHPPKPTLTASQWADTYGMLPRSTSAEPGKWRTDRAPYQRGILDEISNPETQKQCWMAAHQVGKTSIILKALGYCVHQDPGPTLVLQPTLEFARDFSRDRLGPEIDVTPVLRDRLRSGNGRRESSDTLLRKEFDNAYIALVGANSAVGLSSRPIRRVFADEISKYPPTAGDKGDPLTLAENRTENFWNRNLFYVSTPGVLGVCRITAEFEQSDQRYYFVPCPHCKEMQRLKWSDIDEATGKRVNYRVDVETACYICEHCGTLIEEMHKAWMLAHGEWRATRPEGQFPGFHLSALYSPWQSWRTMLTKWAKAQTSRELLQVFINEELAEPWDPNDGEAMNPNALASRRERYAAEVPNAVGILTASVDCHPDWLEVLVKGWAPLQESYDIAHHRIRGSIHDALTWQRLDDVLTKAYRHESGAEMHVKLCGIDSGDGNTIHDVYSFVAPRQRRAVCPIIATKGSSERNRAIVAGKPSRPNKYRVRVFPVGTIAAKDVLFGRLRSQRNADGSTPPGFIHFPQGAGESFDDEFFKQFGNEQVVKKYDHGVPYRVYEVHPEGSRTESIDLEGGNLHALHVLGASVYDNLSDYQARVQAEGARRKSEQPDTDETPQPRVMPAPQPQRPAPMAAPRRPGGWSGGRNRW